MDITPSATAPPAVARPAGRVPRGLTSATIVLCGTLLSLVGMTWDIQWHSDVGPDTFFTLPHLFLYAGSAVAGVASLIVVLASTAGQRSGRAPDPVVGGPAIDVFGRTFAAPVGYLVAGSGAALFLIYGLWDQWWHTLYGFDATIDSPPHIGFMLSVTITMAGVVTVFAAARQERWGRTGMILGAATLVAFGVIAVAGLEGVPLGPADAVDIGTAFICVLALTMCAAALARPMAALAVAGVIAAMQVVLWWFDPWAAEAYAQLVGLPMRDYLDGVPMHPAMIPMVLVVVGALIVALRRLPAWVPGAIGGGLVGLCAPVQRALLYGTGAPDVVVVVSTAVGAAALGALAGYLGSQIIGEMLRQLAPNQLVSNKEAQDA